MNILIESGATKSTCIGYHGTCIFFTYKTVGINATYTSKENIIAFFEDMVAKNNIRLMDVENIRYYGAGCFNPENAEKIKELLTGLFPNVHIVVYSDLYAACHALCHHQRGFVGILGTGAASCLYDGEQIIDKAPSLGYLLGDEGSGVHLGKQFVIKYLSDNMDAEVVYDFEKTFTVSKQKLLEKVYQEEKPQTFFASIPIFLGEHLKNAQVVSLIENSFQEFFNKQFEYYRKFEYPWFFCGSMAYYFQNILKEIAHKNHIHIKGIIQACAPYLLNLKS